MPTPSTQLLSRTIYDIDGTTTVWNFSFSGGYIDPSHVKAYTELPNGIRTPIIVTPEMLIGEFQLQVTPALPPSAGLLVIYRDTPKDLPLVDFVEGPLSEVALDTNARQAVFIAAEAQDEFASTNYQIAVDAASAAVASANQANIDAGTAASAASAAGSSALLAAEAATAAGNASAAASTSASLAATYVGSLGTTGGAANVGADDAASGSLFTTVQGFITRAMSGAGAALFGFDWAALPAAINKIDWGIQTAGNGVNVLRYIPPSEWPDILNGTSVYDCAANIQAAVSSGKFDFYIPSGRFVIGTSVLIPWGVSLIGANARRTVLASKVGGTYTANSMILCNTTDGVTWVQSYPNIGVGKIENVCFDNDAANISGLIGVISAGSYVHTDIRGHNMTTIVQSTADYNDNVEIRRIISRNAGAGYQVKVNQLGDGLIIEGCHFPPRTDNTFPLGIELIGCTGGTMREIIGGNNRVYRCSNVAIERPHLEGSTITIDSSSVHLMQMFATPNEQNQANIRLLSTDGGKYAVTIDGYHNAVWDNRIPSTYNQYDIQTHSDYEMTIRNCYKRAYRSGNITISEITGVLLQRQDGSDFAQFNKLSHYLSAQCRIQRFQNAVIDLKMQCGTGAFFSLSNTVTTGNVAWRKSSGTYYYRMQYVYDDIRKIGVTDSDPERSFTLANGGSALQHVLSFSSRNPNVLCRLYRGTSSGVYTETVDIPLVSARQLFDDGLVVNGHPWVARTAGGVDLTNTTATQIELTPTRTKIISTTTPTVGTFAAGDKTEYLNPAAGGFSGVVCTTAGAPGTWKTYGAISA